MTRPIHAEVVEGNDVWFANRVTMPTGDVLTRTGTNGVQAEGGGAELIQVFIIMESVVGGNREVRKVLSVTTDANVAAYVFDSLEFDYWDGHDDIGYNFLYQLPATGTDSEGNAYILDGGNDYFVEFAIKTTNFGTIRWSAKLHVRGLHSL